jgi:hypothetical protein
VPGDQGALHNISKVFKPVKNLKDFDPRVSRRVCKGLKHEKYRKYDCDELWENAISATCSMELPLFCRKKIIFWSTGD